MPYRVGIGYDIHRLVKGRKLFLGGVEIPFVLGLKGHSDADVLLHALCDALLGAMGKGDIGEFFPNTDLRYRNISSLILLEKVMLLARKNKYKVCNVDAVVIAEAPKIGPFKDKMKDSISKVLKIRKDSIGIKATTSEGLGDTGKGKGIAGYCVVMLKKGG